MAGIWKRFTVALSIALVATIAPLAVVNADSIIDFKCATVTWQGSIFPTDPPTLPSDRSSGKLKLCLTVTRKSDSNASYDFYEARMEAEWSVTQNGGWPDNHAYGHIMSSIPANEYKSTPTVTSNHSCTSPLSFFYSFLGFGVGVSPSICSGSTITRTSQSSSIVFYDTPNVLKTPVWDEVYFVKVGAGSHPKFTAAMHYPSYSITYNYSCPCWKNGDVSRLVTVAIQS